MDTYTIMFVAILFIFAVMLLWEATLQLRRRIRANGEMLVPSACIKCGRGCKAWEIQQCAMVAMDDELPADRGHDGLYA